MREKKNKWIDFEGRRVKDITGKVYGMLTALYPVAKYGNGYTLWKFKCECGNEKDIDPSAVRRYYKSCGCLRKKLLQTGISRKCVDAAAVANFKDLVTMKKKFGRLRVIELWTRKRRKYKGEFYNVNYWECICDCGNTHIAEAGNLLRGNTKSCGCLRSEMMSLRMKAKYSDRKLLNLTNSSENQNCGNHS